MSDLHLTRTVAGSPDVVWTYFTQGDLFATWYGPPGAKIGVAEMEPVSGGIRRFSMSMATPDGETMMWFCGHFKELSPTRRVVYTEAMCDESGAIADPASMTEVIVELADNGETTEVAITHIGVPEDSPGAMGWNMALDKLVDVAS